MPKTFVVSRHVKYTLRVTLDSEWCKAMGLKEGDRVTEEKREDGSLVLRPVRKGKAAAAVA